MTREEREDAINCFKNKIENEVYGSKYNKLALEALEQESCDDCISRDSAIKALDYDIKCFEFKPGVSKHMDDIAKLLNTIYETQVNNIKTLPSVTQDPRWIPVSERLPDTDDEVLCWYEYYHWSQGKVLPEYGLGRYLKETSSWSGEVASGRDVRVIAWMPLPKEYKAESEVEEGNDRA